MLKISDFGNEQELLLENLFQARAYRKIYARTSIYYNASGKPPF